MRTYLHHVSKEDLRPEVAELRNSIPSPETVRVMLGRNLREAKVLRRMLKLAMDARDAATPAAKKTKEAQ